MPSITEVVNIALLECGSEIVADIDQPVDRARYMKARLEVARDLILKAHPWNFALTRDQLAADPTAPKFGWSYRYRLPTDPYCLRVWMIGERRAREVPHTVEGRWLLTNEAGPLNILYIARITDASIWDPFFCQALGLHLAHSNVYKLQSNSGREQELRKKALDFLRLGQSIDGQEGFTDDGDDDDDSDMLGARA